MAGYYLVQLVAGPDWDHARGRREQEGWDAHASFMDGLVEEGFVILGGPVGEGDGDHALLVVNAPDEGAVRAALAADPWAGSVLKVGSVQPWQVWLRARDAPGPS